MVNLVPVFQKLVHRISSGDPNLSIRMHEGEYMIDDSTTGLSFHLHTKDKPFEIYRGDTRLLDGKTGMNQQEAAILTNLVAHLQKHDAERSRKEVYDLYMQNMQPQSDHVQHPGNGSNGGYQ